MEIEQFSDAEVMELSQDLERTSISPEMDQLEELMLEDLEMIDLPLVHRFTQGMYIREIFMPEGSLVVSKVHKTEHPYTIMSGSADVYIPGVGVHTVEAGYVGITKPDTRRALHIKEDCRWATFHTLSPEEELFRENGASEEELLEMIEDRIIATPVLTDNEQKNVFVRYLEKLKEQENKQISEVR
jgi:hypothetical protein